MKFSHSLKFNAVPEWQDQYLNYPQLKKVIYNAQQAAVSLLAPQDGLIPVNQATISDLVRIARRNRAESSKPEEDRFGAKFIRRLRKREDVEVVVEKEEKEEMTEVLLENSSSSGSLDLSDMEHAAELFSVDADPLPVFAQHVIAELRKIDTFFEAKEAEVFARYDALVAEFEVQKISSAVTGESLEKKSVHVVDLEKGESDADDSEAEDEPHWALLSQADFDDQRQITLKKRLVQMFISLSELKLFVELNRIGFTKICKKFDKTCNYAVKDDFIVGFLPTHSRAFAPPAIARLEAALNRIVQLYAHLAGRLEHLDAVRDELRSNLRDHIVWERNTVWTDLLAMEKRTYNLQVDDDARKMGDEGSASLLMQLQLKQYTVGGRTVTLPRCLFTWQVLKLLVIVVVFIVLLTVRTFHDREQARCLAVLVALAMLWATEALPLWVTSLFVPLLVVTCKTLKNSSGGPMSGPDAATYILLTMWLSTLMILLGGFTLAAALSKYNIAKVVLSWMLAFAGTKPRNILLAIMSVSLFLLMWISNVAAPVLAFSLIQPILRTIPTELPFAKALVLGIAYASNIGGMASPIASPQNVIAIQYMNPNPGWGKWFAVAIPVSICCLIGIWLELVFTFKISAAKIKAYKPIKERFTTKQYFICVVTLATILLWCVLSKIESTFGNAGIIAVVPIVLLFGTGLLKTEDVNNFPWTIILLAMGGLALGNAVTSSGLLATVAKALQKKIYNFNVFVILLIFGILILVVATFISHTVATIIIVPLVKEVGEAMPKPHPLILIMGTALLASAAMALPTSGFPNVTAISMTDEVGKRYLTVNTFISRGIPASLISYVFVITVGYGVMTAMNF